MSCVKCEDCQVRATRTVLRSGPSVSRVTLSTLVMGVMWSRVPGSMFQASYCFGVSLKVWSWLPQALGARYEFPLLALRREVMQPLFLLISSITTPLLRPKLSIVSWTLTELSSGPLGGRRGDSLALTRATVAYPRAGMLSVRTSRWRVFVAASCERICVGSAPF